MVDYIARAGEFADGRWTQEEGTEVKKASATMAIAIMLALLVWANVSEG